jgi:hypothetical protein
LGVAFVPGTRSVLFFGPIGTGNFYYGEAAAANDANRTSKGPHSIGGNYVLQVWAYDANDFVAVKDGQKNPWDITPYATWNFDFPLPDGPKYMGGVAFDPATGRLYVSEVNEDTSVPFTYTPLIQVFQVTPYAPPPSTGSSQTSVADFTAGTQSNTMVTDMSGGEVSLLSSFRDEFDGTALGSAWTTTSWTPSGGGPTSVTEAGGILSVAGAEVLAANTATGAGVEGSVNFGAAPYQNFGMATDLSTAAGNDWALFGTEGTSGTLFAQVNVSGTTQSVSLGALPSGFHDYRIEPVSGGIQFSVDGVVLTTINLAIPANTPMAIAMSTFNGSPQPAMQVDWVRTTSYATSGTFTSSTLDAGRNVVWGAVNWTANLPTGTSITVLTSSSTDGVNWSAWTVATNGGTVGSPSGRYLRYRIVLTTTDPTVTPSLSSIVFTWD